MKKTEGFRLAQYALMAILTLAVALACVCLGSVNIPLTDTLRALWNTALGRPVPEGVSKSIIIFVRLPRVLAVGLTGASLSLAGAAMQGLLRNPLADGSTLGVSSGASLGAVLSIAFAGFLPFPTTMASAMAFAFISMLVILGLSYKLDNSLSTNTIILVGVIFSMFASSLMSLVISFSGEKIKQITFWTMGSLAGAGYSDALAIFVALIACGGAICLNARELNAFAVGEENARHVGVNVRAVKLTIMIAVSALIGVCVSIGGTIGFVGLVTPHMTRMITGPNHKRLLPASLFSGAIFLMLADLAARTILSPIELPIGVVTSLIGSAAFLYIFYAARKKHKC